MRAAIGFRLRLHNILALMKSSPPSPLPPQKKSLTQNQTLSAESGKLSYQVKKDP